MSLLRLSRALPSWMAMGAHHATRCMSTEVVSQGSRVPVPRTNIKTPDDFLKAIGRESETKVNAESWEGFWKMNGPSMRSAGIGVSDRRYILWCMEKYRLGLPIADFAHDAPPKKTIRGWGPKVQNGKRIRSRRMKTK